MSYRYRIKQSPASCASVRPNRFTGPFSTQQPQRQPASTPTPPALGRFRSTPRLKDEIQTSFEESDWPSTGLPAKARLSSCTSQPRKGIDDVDEDSDEGDGTIICDDHGDLNEQDGNEELDDLEFLERLRGTRTTQVSLEGFDSEGSSLLDFKPSTPQPRQKRRRLDDVTHHDFNTTNDDDPQLCDQSNERTRDTSKVDRNDHSSGSSLPSSPVLAPSSVARHHQCLPNSISSRFRIPCQSGPTFANQPTGFSKESHKPTFIHRHPDHQPASVNKTFSSPSLIDLPPAFSPSRRGRGRTHGRLRNGKDDILLPNGAAATVRSWVLGLGAIEEEEQTRQHHQRGSVDGDMTGEGSSISRRKAKKLKIERIICGSYDGHGYGRCVLVRDGNGKKWVLTGGGREGNRRVEVDKFVAVRLSWDLDLRVHARLSLGGRGVDADEAKNGHDDHRDDDHDDEDDNYDGDLWKVAALWDIVVDK